MLVPFQLATSSRTLVVSSETSETWPPMIPAIPVGPVLVADEDGLGVERGARLAVEGRHRLAVLGRRARSARRSGTLSRSKACSGWAVSSIT